MPNMTVAAIRATAERAGFKGDEITTATAIALAESAGNPTATNRNKNGSVDYGVWQINSIHQTSPPYASLLRPYWGQWMDPEVNARMARVIYMGGGWKAWATYTSGAYKGFMTVAAPPAGKYVTVVAGQTLSGIARVELGDATLWRKVWDDPRNAPVRALRGAPERIQPGDVFWVAR